VSNAGIELSVMSVVVCSDVMFVDLLLQTDGHDWHNCWWFTLLSSVYRSAM